MKKVVLTIMMLSGIYAVNAQSWSDDFQFGARGGVNLSSVVGDDIDSPDARTGFYAGFIMEAPLSERVSLQPEVFYSTQGFESEDLVKTSFKIDYIQVPLIVKIYIIDGLNIHAGPQFGFKVNEEVDISGENAEIEFDTNSIKDFDIQLTSGLEYKFGQNFFAQARYSRGFSEMIEDAKIYNSVFSFGVGFMF